MDVEVEAQVEVEVEVEVCRDGEVDCSRLTLLSRLGGEYYSAPREIFQMKRHREEPAGGGTTA